MKHGFGFNTNLFETNILNLVAVIGIVVIIVGDAVQSVLDQRRQNILLTLTEADKKAREARKRLEEAKKSVVCARYRAQEIRLQAIQIAEKTLSSSKTLPGTVRYLHVTNCALYPVTE